MRSEIASVVTYVSRYGNAIVDGREKNQWLKSIIDHYCQGFQSRNIVGIINVVLSAGKYIFYIINAFGAQFIWDDSEDK